MSIMKMFLPEMKSDLMSSVIQNPNKQIKPQNQEETIPEELAKEQGDIEAHFELGEDDPNTHPDILSFEDIKEEVDKENDEEMMEEAGASQDPLNPGINHIELSSQGLQIDDQQKDEETLNIQGQQDWEQQIKIEVQK